MAWNSYIEMVKPGGTSVSIDSSTRSWHICCGKDNWIQPTIGLIMVLHEPKRVRGEITMEANPWPAYRLLTLTFVNVGKETHSILQ